MSEQQGGDTYIRCNACKCKYINDQEHIKNDFGYNRLEERYKTCVKCRSVRKKRMDRLRQEAENNKDNVKHCYRCYKNKPLKDFVCPNGKSYNACYACLDRRYNQSEPSDIPQYNVGRNLFDEILDPSSDENDIWGGKGD